MGVAAKFPFYSSESEISKVIDDSFENSYKEWTILKRIQINDKKFFKKIEEIWVTPYVEINCNSLTK